MIECPKCGYSFSVIYRRPYFTDPSVRRRPLIMHTNGLFIREDLVRSLNLRTPSGSHPPGRVRLRASGQDASG